MLSKSHLIIIDLLIVWTGIILYLLFPFDQLRINVNYEWYFHEHISWYIILYLGILYIPYSIWNIHAKDSVIDTRIGRLIFNKNDRKKELLIYLLKLFFIPSMLSLTIQNGIVMVEYLLLLFNNGQIDSSVLFSHNLYPLIIYTVLFITTGLYTIGYIVESKLLNSEIKSIDTSFFGWLVTLVCYYPFYLIISNYLPMMTNDFSYFINDTFTIIVFISLIPLHLFKLWCVITLGWKCSNLTNRGIIRNGPYKWVRHPHYAVKLLIWWITFLPILINDPIYIIGMLFWTLIYYLRAITEEYHLMNDQEYVNYKNQVIYRFIPTLI
jgi:protein-S-isoprenylcysteine O-methyltransferase Ste14